MSHTITEEELITALKVELNNKNSNAVLVALNEMLHLDKIVILKAFCENASNLDDVFLNALVQNQDIVKILASCVAEANTDSCEDIHAITSIFKKLRRLEIDNIRPFEVALINAAATSGFNALTNDILGNHALAISAYFHSTHTQKETRKLYAARQAYSMMYKNIAVAHDFTVVLSDSFPLGYLKRYLQDNTVYFYLNDDNRLAYVIKNPIDKQNEVVFCDDVAEVFDFKLIREELSKLKAGHSITLKYADLIGDVSEMTKILNKAKAESLVNMLRIFNLAKKKVSADKHIQTLKSKVMDQLTTRADSLKSLGIFKAYATQKVSLLNGLKAAINASEDQSAGGILKAINGFESQFDVLDKHRTRSSFFYNKKSMTTTQRMLRGITLALASEEKAVSSLVVANVNACPSKELFSRTNTASTSATTNSNFSMT